MPADMAGGGCGGGGSGRRCACEGGLTGPRCAAPCEAGRTGAFCNETRAPLRAVFPVSFTYSRGSYASPAWPVVPNSEVNVTVVPSSPAFSATMFHLEARRLLAQPTAQPASSDLTPLSSIASGDSSLTFVSGPTSNAEVAQRNASTVSGERSLSFVLKFNQATTEALIPELWQCRDPLTEEQKKALDLLKASTDGKTWTAVIDDFVRTSEACWKAASARLVGSSAQGAAQTAALLFSFGSLAITEPGRFRVAFRLAGSGQAAAVSGPVETVLPPCGAPGLWHEVDACVFDCRAGGLAASGAGSAPRFAAAPEPVACVRTLPRSARFLTVRLASPAVFSADLAVTLYQPLATAPALCCAGGAHCLEAAGSGPVTHGATTLRCACEGFEGHLNGYPATRADADAAKVCTPCATDVSGSVCAAAAAVGLVVSDEDRDIASGAERIVALEVSPQTAFTVELTVPSGDVDASVGFAQCPGQVPASPASSITVPCSGHGACMLGDLSSGQPAYCSCADGYEGPACDEPCCSGHGACGESGCACAADGASGFWAGGATRCGGGPCSAPGGAQRTPADHCVFAAHGAAYAGCGANGSDAAFPAADPARVWVSWRGLEAAGGAEVDYFGITYEEVRADPRCYAPQRVTVYATNPVDATAPSPADVGAWQSGLPCGVVLSRVLAAGAACPADSTWDSAASQCRCDERSLCAWGKCVPLGDDRCGSPAENGTCSSAWPWVRTVAVDGFCRCPTVQADNDELTAFVCDDGVCVEQVSRLSYRWTQEQLAGLRHWDNATSPDMQWAGVTGSARFLHEVTSFVQHEPAADGGVREIDATAWASKLYEGLRFGTFDLSFVLVTEPLAGSGAGADACQPAVKAGSVALVTKLREGGGRSRLFFAGEAPGRSAAQSSHPYYALWTADGGAELAVGDAAGVREVRRYEAVEARPAADEGVCDEVSAINATRPTTDCACGKRADETAIGGRCNCPQDTFFQDPADFVQVGSHMFFLATADWEGVPPDGSAPCDSDSTAKPFQGSREIFYTKGLPQTRQARAAAVRSDVRLGSSAYPVLSAERTEAEIRESVLGMQVFTRAKELVKARNPACGLPTAFDPCPGDPQHYPEMLVFAAAPGGGDPVAVELGASLQPTVRSELLPRVLALPLSAAGVPAAGVAPVHAAPNVQFPSYLTPIPASPEATRIFFLGQARRAFLPANYSPLGASRGYGAAVSGHQYVVPTRLSVFVSDGTAADARELVAASGVNVKSCEHQQGHPGFVHFKDAVYFVFDDGDGTGPQLYRHDLAAPASAAAKIELGVLRAVNATHDAVVALKPWLPPLNKGYLKLQVVPGGEFLVLGLGSPARGWEDEDGNPSGNGCLPAKTCGLKPHSFRKAFPCLNATRGRVELWRWDGNASFSEEGAHLTRIAHPPASPNFASGATDPKWLHATKDGLFWVAHETGMTHMGAFLNRSVDGVVYPADQFVDRERQTVYFAPFSTLSEGAATTLEARGVWSTGVPAEPFQWTNWGGHVYFWSHDPAELAEAYDAFDSAAGSCFPPGRLQDVVYRDDIGRLQFSKVMSGVNVPAYAGCGRNLYRMRSDGTAAPELVRAGTPNDGVGVPRTQCCGTTFASGIPSANWPNASGFTMSDVGGPQAGRSCSYGSDGCEPDPSLGYPAGEPVFPKGCTPCFLPRGSFPVLSGDTVRDFLYPSFTTPSDTLYSLNTSWSYPHTGWWHTGFNSIWTDERVSRAAGVAVNSSGYTEVGKYHIRGHELYRPGGFAWREHWPSVMAVWEDAAPAARDDCGDCAAGYYGAGCARACPLSPRALLCPAEDEAGCRPPACSWNNGSQVCESVTCDGYPCADGYYGNGTCLCPGMGFACQEVEQVTTLSFPVSADEPIIVGPECPAGSLSNTCGHPTTATCSMLFDCGAAGDEPCCGRGPEPMQVSGSRWVLLSFFNVEVPAGSVASATLKLVEQDGGGCDTRADIAVDGWVGGAAPDAIAAAMESTLSFQAVVAALGSARRFASFASGRTQQAARYVSLDSGLFPAGGTVNVTLVLRADPSTQDGACVPFYAARESRSDWAAFCAAGGGRCVNGAAPGGRNERVPARPADASWLVLDVLPPASPGSRRAPSALSRVFALFGMTTGDDHPPAAAPPPRTGRAGVVQSAGLSLRRATALSAAPPAFGAFSPVATLPLVSAPGCTLSGRAVSETCTILTPGTSGYAVVRLTAITSSKYTARVSYTPRGTYSAARPGSCADDEASGHWGGELCLDCKFRYSGENCTDYVPAVCDAASCPAGRGVCLPDSGAGNTRVMCACEAGLGGVACDIPCDAKTCAHGSCREDGSCACFGDDSNGHWAGAACDACVRGFFGSRCALQCSCRYGLCDTTSPTGSCLPGSCTSQFAGERCDECAEGFYGSLCETECSPATCHQGLCDAGGNCKCDEDSGFYADLNGTCTAACYDDTCSGNGLCLASDIGLDPAAPCTCYLSPYAGFWDVATNCTTCKPGFWGVNCTDPCDCNSAGLCDLVTGVCACYDDDVNGRFHGERCERCQEGYAGDCTSRATTVSGPRIGKAYSIDGAEVVPKAEAARVAGSLFYTTADDVEARAAGTFAEKSLADEEDRIIAGTTEEVIFASSGRRKGASRSLIVDVWAKTLGPSIDFRGKAARQFAVHTRSPTNALFGRSVRGMFQDGPYFFFVVADDSRSYIGRTWAVYSEACPLCLHPENVEVGLQHLDADKAPYDFAASKTCSVGCPVGQQVLVSRRDAPGAPIPEQPGLIVAINATSRRPWVVLESGAPCDAAAAECLPGHPRAHLLQNSGIRPLVAVAWLRPTDGAARAAAAGAASQSYEIVAWKFEPAGRAVHAVVLESDVLANGTRIPAVYHLQRVPTAGFEAFSTPSPTPSLRLTHFDPTVSNARVDTLHVYAEPGTGEPVALVFGLDTRGLPVLQKINLPSAGRPGYKVVFSVTPGVCSAVVCRRQEAVVPLRGLRAARNETAVAGDEHAVLLFARSEAAPGLTRYAVQRLDLANLKEQSVAPLFGHGYCSQFDSNATACESARCVWGASEARCGRPVAGVVGDSGLMQGIGFASFDPDFGFVYFSVGAENAASPSLVFKVDALSLRAVLQRRMDYGHVATEVEALVAGHFDRPRRALLALTHFSRTSIAVIPAYDTVSISPDVADAPIAGTLVTVKGVGFTSLRGAFHPACSMGPSVSSGAFELIDGELVVVCTAAVPETYTACNWLALEVATNRADPRWTETGTLVKRINTALILSLSTERRDNGSWVAIPDPEAAVAMPGPLETPWGTGAGGDFQLIKTVQAVTTGPFDRSVVVAVHGAGFFESPNVRCSFGANVTAPATVVSAIRLLCLQPRLAEPMRTTVEVTLDGQVFSRNRRPYYAVGDAVAIEAFYTCSPFADACTSGRLGTVGSGRVVTLDPVVVIFKDSAGTFVGSVWTKGTVGNVSLQASAGGLPLAGGSLSKPPVDGRVVFEDLRLELPLAGTYTLTLSYSDAELPVPLVAQLPLTVSGGAPHRIVMLSGPPAYSNNRAKLTVQPSIRILDVAGNAVTDGELTVVASFGNFPGDLRGPDGTPWIEIRSGVGHLAGTAYDFEGLEVRAAPGAPIRGRRLQYVQRGLAVEQLDFDLLFTVHDARGPVEGLNTLSSTLHMVDCSTDYVGNSKLSWIEPEEQPAFSTAPIIVKGWEFRDVGDHGQYKCQLYEASTNVLLGSVDATYLDSCSVSCLPPSTVRNHAAMFRVVPVLCCADAPCPQTAEEEANCMPEELPSFNSFNMSLRKINFYHRYVGQPVTLGVWNLVRSLPDAKLEYHPYDDALEVQALVSQQVQLSPSKSLGARLSKSGDYLYKQYERDDFEYSLWLHSDSIVNKETVLRADEHVTIAGARFWKPNDWQHASTVSLLERHLPETSFRVALLDDAVGLHNWQGNWVADQNVIRDGVALSSQVTIRVTPLLTAEDPATGRKLGSVRPADKRFHCVFSVNGGPDVDELYSAEMNHSRAVFEGVVLRSPAKGTYRVLFQHSNRLIRDVEATIRILEGLPDRVVFDDEKYPRGVHGVPSNTLTNARELTRQPRFRLLDKADNTLTDLPSNHDIRVRVKGIAPSWPRCLPAVACDPSDDACEQPDPSAPGMWGVRDPVNPGVCLWNTPDLSDTSATAAARRSQYDPVFDSSGIAAYGLSSAAMNIWASREGAGYAVTFAFYGAGLEQFGYALPDLTTAVPIVAAQCPGNCPVGDKACWFEPTFVNAEVDAASVGETLVIYGDYFDVATAGRAADELRVELDFFVNQTHLVCQVQATLRDACSLVTVVPTCEYLCVNLHPPEEYSAADRESCCKTGFKADEATLCVSAAVATLSAPTTQRRAVSLDVDPAGNHTIAPLVDDGVGETLFAAHHRAFAVLSEAVNPFASPAITSLKVATTCPSASDCSAPLSTARASTGPPKVGQATQIGMAESELALSAVDRTHRSSSLVGPIAVTVTTKDTSGNDVWAKDQQTRRVRLTLQKRIGAGLRDWRGADCSRAECLPHADRSPARCEDPTEECVFFVATGAAVGAKSDMLPVAGEAELTNGSATFYVVLQAPKARTFGFQVADVTPVGTAGYASSRLPSCTGPLLHPETAADIGLGFVVSTSAGDHRLPYLGSDACSTVIDGYATLWTLNVVKGDPHHLAWGAPPASEVQNDAAPVEYVVQVRDFADNVLGKEDVKNASQTAWVKVSVQATRLVPELRRNATASLLFARRDEPYTMERIEALEREACAIGIADGGLSVDLGGGQNPSQAHFVFTTLRVWHGMSCLLTFSARTDDPAASDAQIALAHKLNANTEQLLTATVAAASCCEAGASVCTRFAYSFEFGCWDQKARRVIDGPNNDPSSDGSPLARVSASNPYACLYECGRCEEGMQCYGNTTLRNEEGHWREPTTYRSWACDTDNCVAGGLGDSLGASASVVLALSAAERSTLQCAEGSEGPLCGVCSHEVSAEAPEGYARSWDTCVACPSHTTSYVLMLVVLLSFIAIVCFLAALGARAASAPKLAIMLKMLLSHVQVVGFVADLAVPWSHGTQRFFDVASHVLPTGDFAPVTCAWGIDYADKVLLWVLVPGAVLAVPGLLLGLTALRRYLYPDASEHLRRRPVEHAPECLSPYHWLYDWCVADGSQSEMRNQIAKHTNASPEDRGNARFNVEARLAPLPRESVRDVKELESLEAVVGTSYAPVKVQRLALDEAQPDSYAASTVFWEARLTPGAYGCWLCQRCCFLEQLFPTPGVGRAGQAPQMDEFVSRRWFRCTVPGHEITEAKLRVAFRGSLLEAAVARLQFLEKAAYRAQTRHRLTDRQMLALAEELFPANPMEDGASDSHSSASEDEGGSNLMTADKSTTHKEALARAQRSRAYAVAEGPPFPAEEHLHFDFPDADPANNAATTVSVAANGVVTFAQPEDEAAKVSLRARKDAAVALVTKLQGNAYLPIEGSKTAHEKLSAIKVSAAGSTSVWRYTRNDVVTGETMEWFSKEDPVTPPRSPKRGCEMPWYATIPLRGEEEVVTDDQELLGMVQRHRRELFLRQTKNRRDPKCCNYRTRVAR
ncbi:Laminin-like protein epi-1 [Diplonema papillatum]|nr:Laminin-like protein epi-1 [Diplonema papillatum]